MGRSTTFAAAMLAALNCSTSLATPGDQQGARGSTDWRGRFCANCQSEHEAVSRLRAEVRIATKLVAANTCADPGTIAWFAEEEDHVSAFLNSGAARYK